MNNNSTNNAINGIRAKKISQLNGLPDDLNPAIGKPDEAKLKNLYFVLGFNNNETVSNYKMNFEELINLLISTGKLSGGPNVHVISYALENITTSSPHFFTENEFDILLIPNEGYELPDNIIINGVSSYHYDKETGNIHIIVGNNDNEIEISASGILVYYTFRITTDLSYEYIGDHKDHYDFGDEITISLSTTDPENYDAPDLSQIQLVGLDIISYNKNNDKATIKLKINGSSFDTYIILNSQRIYHYYFGYSINGDNILEYEDEIPVGIGNNFESLLCNTRNTCPIPFNEGFNYGEMGHVNVYLVVPEKYYVSNKHIFIDDTYNSYTLKAGNSGFSIPVQINPRNNKQMLYESLISYKDVNYVILCISREGKIGHQEFDQHGNVSNVPYKIEWSTLLKDNYIKEGQVLNASSGNTIKIYYIGGATEVKTSGFEISIEQRDGIDLGTYENNIYTAPQSIEDETYVTFICKYTYDLSEEPLTSIATLTLVKAGEDEGLYGIELNLLTEIEILSKGSKGINVNCVNGLYENTSPHTVAKPELIQFEVINGVGSFDGFTYKAPTTKINMTAEIKATYKGHSSNSVFLNIIGSGFDGLLWPTDLPKSIYDDADLYIDTTLYKIVDEGSGRIELIDNNIHPILTVTNGTLTGNYYVPGTVNEDTTVTFKISYNNYDVEKEMIIKHYNPEFTVDGLYWYIGQYEPTGYTNPLNDLITNNNDVTGWRKIEESNNYYKENPLYEYSEQNKIAFHDGATYYVALPEGFVFKDNFGEIIEKSYVEINIKNKKYNIYMFETELEGNEETFEYNIYYNDLSPYYIYWGSNLPTINTNPEDELSQIVIGTEQYSEISYSPGWYNIGTSINATSSHYKISTPTFNDLYDIDGEEYPANYLIIPKYTEAKDGVFGYQLTGIAKLQEITIQGKDYVVYNITNDMFKIDIQFDLYLQGYDSYVSNTGI